MYTKVLSKEVYGSFFYLFRTYSSQNAFDVAMIIKLFQLTLNTVCAKEHSVQDEKECIFRNFCQG